MVYPGSNSFTKGCAKVQRNKHHGPENQEMEDVSTGSTHPTQHQLPGASENFPDASTTWSSLLSELWNVSLLEGIGLPGHSSWNMEAVGALPNWWPGEALAQSINTPRIVCEVTTISSYNWSWGFFFYLVIRLELQEVKQDTSCYLTLAMPPTSLLSHKDHRKERSKREQRQ